MITAIINTLFYVYSRKEHEFLLPLQLYRQFNMYITEFSLALPRANPIYVITLSDEHVAVK